ncbi:MAG: SIS domain-containing protein [Bacteroidetes bacterium]|nr:MAG: SIS domain-containing protein [Bacteroidota bacterium]
MTNIQGIILQSIAIKNMLLSDSDLIERIQQAADMTTECLRKDHKVLFCGNGGSAADAQHLAAELSGRFYLDRPPLFAEALHANTSFLTAVGNDFCFEDVFARAVEAKGRHGDLLFALSTSGNSENVFRAAQIARKKNMRVIGLTGESGGKLGGACDLLIRVPSEDTPRIQEIHILIGHIICELVEAALFGKPED